MSSFHSDIILPTGTELPVQWKMISSSNPSQMSNILSLLFSPELYNNPEVSVIPECTTERTVHHNSCNLQLQSLLQPENCVSSSQFHGSSN